MYQKWKVPEKFTLPSGEESTAIVTLEDEYGGKCQIGIDDHCYVLYLKHEGTRGIFYKSTTHIFREAHAVLIELPAP